ncbi:MAG TPA: hemerythrin domain-containing protein [Jatrophihabitans sp.]|jgi:hemerythrin superfamily protein|nr:hemerythrin domain-containing protein [Jatrophihabitans sp.]
MGSAKDKEREAVPLLLDQHRQMADLFRRTLDATGAERRREFTRLRRLIAAHETAEEVLVHPRMRWTTADGDAQARARIEEETEIKTQLAELEPMDVDSDEFAAGLAEVRAVTLAHNDAEELEEFPVLADQLDAGQRARLRRGLALVEAVAPTRPHPGLTLGGENVLAGGITAMVDRVRDLLTHRTAQ